MWESRVLRRAFERLELHEGKLSRAVLRGGGGGDVTSLPDAGVGNHPGLPGRRRTGVRPEGAHVVPGRQRNEKPVSSMKTMAACFRRAFFADPRPILLKPGPDHFLISLFGVNGRDLWAPTRSSEPSGQVIRMVRDTELARIRSRIRRRVQRSVSNPALRAPLRRVFRMLCHCAADNRGGRPGLGRLRRALSPEDG